MSYRFEPSRHGDAELLTKLKDVTPQPTPITFFPRTASLRNPALWTMATEHTERRAKAHSVSAAELNSPVVSLAMAPTDALSQLAGVTPRTGAEAQDADSDDGFLGVYADDGALRTARSLGSMASLGKPPHSRNLVLDAESQASVLQAAASSGAEVVEVVAEQSWLLTKLTLQLLWALRMSQRWILCALRLLWFALLLLPPMLQVALYWFTDENVHKNIIYGLEPRNLLDVYTVPHQPKAQSQSQQPPLKARSESSASVSSTASASYTEARYPVVVFVTGGAWIIGYKAWGALMGRVLASLGVVVVMPDYRNFPQGVVPDMVADSTRALQWVFDRVHLFGGDRDNVHLVGQSAGAHIALCALLELVETRRRARSASSCASPSTTTSSSSVASAASSDGENLSASTLDSAALLGRPPTWELRQLRSYIGISGPFNMEASVGTFHRHGFDRAVVERVMAQRLGYYSPALRFEALATLPPRERAHLLADFPPCFLFHGTADKTVSWRSTAQLAAALRACHVPVTTRFFKGKTHTDAIIEDPIVGDDFLLDDVMAVLKARAPVDPRTGRPRYELGTRPQEKRYYPRLLVRLARAVNPF